MSLIEEFADVTYFLNSALASLVNPPVSVSADDVLEELEDLLEELPEDLELLEEPEELLEDLLEEELVFTHSPFCSFA